LYHTSGSWNWQGGRDRRSWKGDGDGPGAVDGVTTMIAAWAQDEMAGADLGDQRLNTRAQAVLSALGNHPNLSLPAACGGRAELVAAYRFFDNDKVTFDKVLQPHLAHTRQRIAGHAEVVLVQDTTEVDLTRPERTVAGVGELDGARRGFLLHEMQAFTPDGTPLGTVSAAILNRTAGVSHASADRKRETSKKLPIERKESMRWLTGLREACRLAREMPAVRFLCVADSEGDIYELFAEPRGGPAVDWLIRACQDRALQPTGTDDPPGICGIECGPRRCSRRRTWRSVAGKPRRRPRTGPGAGRGSRGRPRWRCGRRR
jgi:Transposase DNA-binding